MEIKQRSAPQRQLWAQFDALQMGSGWDEEDIQKPQILLEDVFGDSHPGSTHLGGIMEQAKYGVFEKGGYPAQYHTTDICDGCAQGHDGMNYILASREAICDMIEVHGSVYPWDGVILSASCDKSIPAQLKAAARLDLPAIFIPGGKSARTPSPPRRYGTIKSPAAPRWVPAPSWAPPAPCSVWPRPWASPCLAPL